MSDSVGIRDLRQHASAVLRRVVAGQTVEVTDHGHPIARIVPLRPGTLDQMVLDGRAIAGDGGLLDRLDELDLPHAAIGITTPSLALAELRADER